MNGSNLSKEKINKMKVIVGSAPLNRAVYRDISEFVAFPINIDVGLSAIVFCYPCAIRWISTMLRNIVLTEIFGNILPHENRERNLEQLEFIDNRNEEDVVGSWSEFIHTHHYDYRTSFLNRH